MNEEEKLRLLNVIISMNDTFRENLVRANVFLIALPLLVDEGTEEFFRMKFAIEDLVRMLRKGADELENDWKKGTEKKTELTGPH